MRRRWARVNHMTISFVTSGKLCPSSARHLTRQLSTSSTGLLLFPLSFYGNLQCVCFIHALLPRCVSSPQCNSWRIQCINVWNIRQVTRTTAHYSNDGDHNPSSLPSSVLWVHPTNQSIHHPSVSMLLLSNKPPSINYLSYPVSRLSSLQPYHSLFLHPSNYIQIENRRPDSQTKVIYWNPILLASAPPDIDSYPSHIRIMGGRTKEKWGGGGERKVKGWKQDRTPVG